MACGNGINSNIFRCMYLYVTPPRTIYSNCHSPNVIYLTISCICLLQYIGETVKNLN